MRAQRQRMKKRKKRFSQRREIFSLPTIRPPKPLKTPWELAKEEMGLELKEEKFEE